MYSSMVIAASKVVDEYGYNRRNLVAIHSFQSLSAPSIQKEKIEKDAQLFISKGLQAILDAQPVSLEVIDWFKANSSNQSYIIRVFESLYAKKRNNEVHGMESYFYHSLVLYPIIGKCVDVLKFVLEGNGRLKYFSFYTHFREILEYGDAAICKYYLQFTKKYKKESFKSKTDIDNMLNNISYCYENTASDKETKQRQGDIIECTLNFLNDNQDIRAEEEKKVNLKDLYNKVHPIALEHEDLLVLLTTVFPKASPVPIG